MLVTLFKAVACEIVLTPFFIFNMPFVLIGCLTYGQSLFLLFILLELSTFVISSKILQHKIYYNRIMFLIIKGC